MSRTSGLRNDMNKRTFYKERKINNRCFDFMSKQNIIVPLILDLNESIKITFFRLLDCLLLKKKTNDGRTIRGFNPQIKNNRKLS